tara:strand:+ start:311750 stop:313018 length:1269 start_codon:yes stop_codon:yes gene_type:complete
MNRVLAQAAASAAALSLIGSVAAQQCYSPQNQCFSFAPPGGEVERIETGLSLRSNQLKTTGDIRMRARFAEAPTGTFYNTNDQQSTRTRVQLDYTVNEFANAFVEFNFSEVWAGSEGYSDAQPDPTSNGFASRENFSGIAQAYLQLEDAFGFDEKIRIGRSNYFLANGMVLGSCDFLQYPGAFTGIWASRSFGDFDLEVFAFDNYGPLQSQLMGGGERYAGGTARWNASENGPVRDLNVYYMSGTNDGDVRRNANDSWVGIEGVGTLPGNLEWSAQFGHRQVSGGMDVSAYRARIERKFEDAGPLRSIAVTRTDSEGALHINPADFNSAGLLHQYGGMWRSDLDTNQLSFALTPGGGVDATVTFLTLDHDGAQTGGINQQLGHSEMDVLLGKEVRPGIHLGGGYSIDNQERQVGYLQVTVFF